MEMMFHLEKLVNHLPAIVSMWEQVEYRRMFLSDRKMSKFFRSLAFVGQ